MTKKKSPKPMAWTEIFQKEHRSFPQGCCITRIIPDKRNRKPKYKKGWDWE